MAQKDHPTNRVRPPLKWAGSKFQILDTIRKHLPTGNRLIEPFVGSGAVFFNTRFDNYLLNDINHDLIDFYRRLQKDGKEFIEYTREFFQPENNTEQAYYHLRDTFNNTTDTYLKAALFLYLNRYGYNGLCRYNSKGRSNVPFGRYKKPYFPEKELELFIEKSRHALFSSEDFSTVMLQAQAGDIIYCDPPYVPLSTTANFTSYSGNGFSETEQTHLAEIAEEVSGKGITVLISNHYTPFTKKIYRKARKHRFEVRRMISCNGKRRVLAKEILAVYSGKKN